MIVLRGKQLDQKAKPQASSLPLCCPFVSVCITLCGCGCVCGCVCLAAGHPFAGIYLSWSCVCVIKRAGQAQRWEITKFQIWFRAFQLLLLLLLHQDYWVNLHTLNLVLFQICPNTQTCLAHARQIPSYKFVFPFEHFYASGTCQLPVASSQLSALSWQLAVGRAQTFCQR